MALWRKRARKRKSQPTCENPSTIATKKQRKLFSPEVKLLAVKALEAGLTPAEVSEIVGAGNSSVTAWARAFRDGGVESLVRKSTSATTRRICEKLERRIEQERRENPESGVRRVSLKIFNIERSTDKMVNDSITFLEKSKVGKISNVDPPG